MMKSTSVNYSDRIINVSFGLNVSYRHLSIGQQYSCVVQVQCVIVPYVKRHFKLKSSVLLELLQSQEFRWKNKNHMKFINNGILSHLTIANTHTHFASL